ncbi:MAG: DUF4981 domain-containing protein, partial [Treponema sp.]|nr:DUF4981 domain-containing protein [Treponema sp.]
MEHRGFHRKNDWQNQHIRQINREAAHSPYGAYGGFEEAREGGRDASSNIQSLDGEWDFFFAETPDKVPEDFFLPGFDAGGWGKIAVPGNLETQGYGTPIYTNAMYPFPHHEENRPWLVKPLGEKWPPMLEWSRPPAVPDRTNYVGCYRRTFTAPAGRLAGRAFLCFDGVESAFYLWVNGRPVGYSQDSKVPADFEVTEYLREGENLIAVEVFRFSDGTWLEDQDYWYLSGIHRSARLVWKPRQFIRDWKVLAQYEPLGGSGRLTAWCYTNLQDGYGDHQVELTLLDPRGKPLLTRRAAFSRRNPEKRARRAAAHFDVVLKGDSAVNTAAVQNRPLEDEGSPYPPALPHPEAAAALFDILLEEVSPWSFDRPELYTLVFTLLDKNGAALDWESQKTGFKKISFQNNVLMLNGKRLIVRGVARHEHHYITGRTMSREAMTAEILLMKKLNFNAVRTSHYPNCPEWYELCDRYGIAVLCEANLETHGVLSSLAADIEWSEAFLERGARMALSYKNYPCIIGWSLGNESGVGCNHAAMANWLHDYDPTRFVQYERGDTEPHISDVRCVNYTPVEHIINWLADSRDLRPVILAEYAHSQANAAGAFFKYWDAVERFDRFQGGFIWDWQDKNLLKKDEAGKSFMAVGDDFPEMGDYECPPVMCCNGVVFADYRPKPAAWEIKNCQSPVKIGGEHPAEGRFVFRNRSQDWGGGAFALAWRITCDGVPLREGTVDLPETPPMDDGRFTLDSGWDKQKKPGKEYFIDLFIIAKEAFHVYEKGHEFYRCQFDLGAGILPAYIKPAGAAKPGAAYRPVEIDEGSGGVNIRFEMGQTPGAARFDKGTGLLTGLSAGEERLLCSAGRGLFFRAPTGVDRGGVLEDWHESGYDRLERRLEDFAVESAGGGAARIRVIDSYWVKGGAQTGGPVIRGDLAYEFAPSGEVTIEAGVEIRRGLSYLPRVGLEFVLDPRLENIAYLGRGPWENYPDRKQSALV